MEKEKIEVLWFKRDLRVEDNPIISFANIKVLPIFIFDKNILKDLPKDDKRVNFIFKNVLNLKNKLKKENLDLAIFYGMPEDIFNYISEKFEISKIYSSSDNEKYSKLRDEKIKENYNLEIIFDNFLIEPEKILSKDGKPYKVFSFFSRKAKETIFENPLKEYKFKNLKKVNFDFENLISLEDNRVEKRKIEIESINFKGEKINFEGANLNPLDLLKRFEDIIENYEEERDFPYKNSTSLLSVHLRFGTISVREVVRWALKRKHYKKFIEELLWREFFNYLFYHFPRMEEEGLRKIQKSWSENEELLNIWKEGKTQVPLVDAGLRQLNEEGFIHNRVRMVVADYLVKHLNINWKEGEKYFGLKLLDYEPSSNIGNWQWVSGIGADPKFLYRRFNPFLQSKKFDPEGVYIKKYVPEFCKLPPSKLHNPKFFKENIWKNQKL